MCQAKHFIYINLINLITILLKVRILAHPLFPDRLHSLGREERVNKAPCIPNPLVGIRNDQNLQGGLVQGVS